jgi:hypothetical protein
MPKVSVEAREGVESAKRVVRRFIPNLETAFRFVYDIDGVVKKDGQGRSNLKLLLISLRRETVKYLFESGFNPAEIANHLRIPIMDVYNDIRRTRKSGCG